MRILKRTTFIAGLLICIASCSHPKDILGAYRSNIAERGQLMTTIRLKPDSSFDYVIQGNLMYDSSFGKYQILDHRLFLSTIWEKTGPYRWSLLERSPKTFISGHDSIEYQKMFYFGDNRLFAANFETGKKMKRNVVYNERKKYILFGGHYYKKCWYLKRISSSFIFTTTKNLI